MPYKAIGFDYGGVVAGPTGKEFNRRVCEFLEISLDQYHQAYFKFNHLIHNGQVTGPEMWQMVLKDLDKNERFDAFIEFQSTMRHHEVHQNIIELIDRLRKNGYKVGLLTNNTMKTAKYIRSTGLIHHFDSCVMSAEIGISKPDPKIFDLFFSKLGVTPREAIFIDDYEISLSTAAEVGYHPIFFSDYSDLIQKLQSVGVDTE